MDQLKTHLASIHPPTVSLTVSLDCDAIVRTSTTSATLTALLTTAVTALPSPPTQPRLHFVPRVDQPPLWLHATRVLDDALTLPSAAASPTALYTAYAAALESVTALAHHTHFRSPLLHFVASWVGETSLPQRADHTTHVILVCRPGSRQDDAALQDAHPRMLQIHGHHNVHVVRLSVSQSSVSHPSASQPPSDPIGDATEQLTPDTPPPPPPPPTTTTAAAATDAELHSASMDIPTFAQHLDRIARHSLSETVEAAAVAADRARRATRTTFRSWFSSTGPAATTALRQPTTPQPSSPTRLTSFSAAARTPLFDPASTEALTRRHADLAFTARQYGDAADAYVQLATDCRALTGLAAVHEAAALEMTALSRMQLDSSRSSVLPALERAMLAYVRACRPELAIRTTLRALAFCAALADWDAAHSFLLRAREAIAPGAGVPSALATGNAFLDAALAVLATACVACNVSMGKRRRASLYAFVAMRRFSALGFSAVGALLAAHVNETAMQFGDVAQHVELVLAAHAGKQGVTQRALGYYAGVFDGMTEGTDVELQGEAVRGFLSTVADGAAEGLPKRWDGGVAFPPVDADEAGVVTRDTGEDCATWRTLEDDVLEDVAYFRALRRPGAHAVKRERRVEVVANELRRREARRGSSSVGGSVEMKIQRLREVAVERRKALRKRSLLERSAVVGDRIRLDVKLKNPLQFPLFIRNICAVVLLNGSLHSSFDDAVQDGDGNGSECDINYFPVDEVTLAPCSVRTVAVDVVSRVAGSLRFIGLTWRFTIGMGSSSTRASTPVPGFCSLEKQGRRLNKTRKQRASETPLYETDMSLAVNIVTKAPRLQIHLAHKTEMGFEAAGLSKPLALRAGELREARVIVENDGEEAVDNIVLRIGTPHVVFLDIAPTKVNRGGKPFECAIGADDLQTRQRDTFLAAETRVNVAPKSVVELPVWLHAGVPASAFAPGNHPWRGRRASKQPYEVIDDGVVQSFGRIAVAYGGRHIRVCRVSVCMHVRRSIMVSPRFMRETEPFALFGEAGRDLKGVLLGVEIEHAGRTPAENLQFDVCQLCVTSRKAWRPMLLPEADEPADRPDGELLPSQSSLRINETATIFALLVCDGEALEQSGGRGSFGGSHESEAGLEEKLWQTFRTRLDSAVCEVDTNVKEVGGVARASSFFLLCGQTVAAVPRDLVYVSVGWRTEDGAIGEMHIPPIDPVRWMRPSTRRSSSMNIVSPIPEAPWGNSSRDDAAQGKSPSISMSVDHAKDIVHDFFTDPLSLASSTTSSSSSSTSPNAKLKSHASLLSKPPPPSIAAYFPAQVPVRVTLRNTCELLVDVSFTAASIGGIADGDRGRHWGGDVSMSLRALPPGSERVLHLTAVLVAPGRFNLSRFHVVVSASGGGGGRRAIFLDESFVTVVATRGFEAAGKHYWRAAGASGDVAYVEALSPVTVSSTSALSTGGSGERVGLPGDSAAIGKAETSCIGMDAKVAGGETAVMKLAGSDMAVTKVAGNGTAGKEMVSEKATVVVVERETAGEVMAGVSEAVAVKESVDESVKETGVVGKEMATVKMAGEEGGVMKERNARQMDTTSNRIGYVGNGRLNGSVSDEKTTSFAKATDVSKSTRERVRSSSRSIERGGSRPVVKLRQNSDDVLWDDGDTDSEDDGDDGDNMINEFRKI